MEEQFKQLKKRIQMLEVKMEFQKENTVAMTQILKDMGNDVDAIIDTFDQVQKRNEAAAAAERFERIEKHVGLS